MEKGRNRRSFIKKIGLGSLAAATTGMANASGIGGKELPEGHDLDNPPGNRTEAPGASFNGKYTGEHLNKIAFPMGGIGAGMVCLEGTGAISHVSIKNKPDVFNEPYMFAALHLKGIENGTKVLEGPVPSWKMFGPQKTANGSGDKTYGLPRFDECSFSAKFPFGTVELKDKSLPVTVKVEGWSPFIPTDADHSSLPLAVLDYIFENTSAAKLSAVFSFNSKNFFDGNGRIREIKNGFHLGSMDDENGGFSVRIDGEKKSIDYCWFRGGWWDAQSILWRNIKNGKLVRNNPVEEHAPGASIHVPFDLAAGQTKTISVNLCWYCPESDISFGLPKPSNGQAFNKPSKGAAKNQQAVSGFKGRGLLNSFDPKGDEQTGVMHSGIINIDRRFLKFLVGGGNDSDKTAIQLIVEDKVVRTASGVQSEVLSEMIWDLKEFAGKEAYLRFIDKSTEGWGHVLADQFVLTDDKDENMQNPSPAARLIEDFEGGDFSNWQVTKENGGVDCCDGSNCDCTYKPWYAGKFKNIGELVQYWDNHCAQIKKNTELFRDAFYASSLPPEVLEAVASNLSILKSPTVLRQTDGRLWAFEGCYDDNGCCHGSCTHVWNYGQALPHLFPSLERSLRETEFAVSQNAQGHQNFRSNLPISTPSHGFHAAADGQLGGILKLYRDWRISGDTGWMKSLFSKAKASMDYCIRTWDPGLKGYLEEPHHNTYDIEFWGANGMCTSFYLGALSAIIEMSKVLKRSYNNYQRLLESGIAFMEKELFNGEYFVQNIKWEGLRAKNPADVPSFGGAYSKEARDILIKEGPKYQYGAGCLSDGIIGMWMSAVCGLDEVVDKNKISSHLLSVHRFNLKSDLSVHSNPQRPTYAAGKEGGLLLCTWPRGGELSLPFVYSNEVWTGIEYQVAAHLILHGKVKEGLEIVRECRKRYDGFIRNPFNEYECGHWYARAMSSYSLLQALTGLRYDAVEKTLYVNSKVGDFISFISTATGFGKVTYKNGKVSADVVYGKIDIERIII